MGLQWLQVFLTFIMSDVMPGQSTDASILEIIDVTRCSDECRTVSMSFHKEGGAIMPPLYMT